MSYYSIVYHIYIESNNPITTALLLNISSNMTSQLYLHLLRRYLVLRN